MNIVTIDVRSLEDTLEDTVVAMETLTSSAPRISFASPELLWKVLTAKRWAILKTLTGAGPVTIREAARRVDTMQHLDDPPHFRVKPRFSKQPTGNGEDDDDDQDAARP